MSVRTPIARKTAARCGLVGFALCVCMVFAPHAALAQAGLQDRGTRGRQIMAEVDTSPRGRDLTARAVWRLIDAKGRERVRETRIFRRETDGDELRSQWLLVFDSPPEIRETALLVWNPRSAREEAVQWLYLAAFRKVKRVAQGDRGDSFMGTDFAFEDLTERPVDDDRHSWQQTEQLDGVSHEVVESLPIEKDAAYAKRRQWVHRPTGTVRRVEYYSDEDLLEKTLEVQWGRSGDAFIWERLEMRNATSGHRTVIETSQTRLDTGLREDLFHSASLRRGGR